MTKHNILDLPSVEALEILMQNYEGRIDFQIQWEADLLENLAVMDIQKQQQEIKKCIDKNFRTTIGKKIAYERFVLD